MKLAIFLLAQVLMADEVRISVSKQPLDAMRAAFGSKINGTALYQVMACDYENLQHDIGGGMVVQVINRRIATIDSTLLPALMLQAHGRNKRQIMAELVKYGGQTASIVMSGGIVAAPPAAMLSNAFLTIVADRLAGKLKAQSDAVAMVPNAFLDGSRNYTIKPRSCIPWLVLGEHDKTVTHFTESLMLMPERAAPAGSAMWAPSAMGLFYKTARFDR